MQVIELYNDKIIGRMHGSQCTAWLDKNGEPYRLVGHILYNNWLLLAILRPLSKVLLFLPISVILLVNGLLTWPLPLKYLYFDLTD
jgi:hypothetical protein